FGNGGAIPLHQMIAKNVGIRRARGKFVLVTNIDIIFSSQLVEFIAGRQLSRAVMYRMDRFDIARNIPAYESVDDLLSFCANHTLRVFAREGEFQLNGDSRRRLDTRDIAAADSGIEFGAGWSAVEGRDEEPHRWLEAEGQLVCHPPSGIPALLLDCE